jgi:hypothetical protein
LASAPNASAERVIEIGRAMIRLDLACDALRAVLHDSQARSAMVIEKLLTRLPPAC